MPAWLIIQKWLWRRVWVDNTPSPCSEIAEHTYTGQGTSTHQQMSRTRQTRRAVAKLNPHVVPFPERIDIAGPCCDEIDFGSLWDI